METLGLIFSGISALAIAGTLLLAIRHSGAIEEVHVIVNSERERLLVDMATALEEVRYLKEVLLARTTDAPAEYEARA